jgi:hypothetical protein
MPSAVKDMIVEECKPEAFAECAVVFSGLDADVAGDIGMLRPPANSSTYLDQKAHFEQQTWLCSLMRKTSVAIRMFRSSYLWLILDIYPFFDSSKRCTPLPLRKDLL